MPFIIITAGLLGLVAIIGGYAIQELSRPYPEERDAKRNAKHEAKRLERHAERDAILARAELLDERTKAEIRRQYLIDQSPPGTEIPEPEPDFADVPAIERPEGVPAPDVPVRHATKPRTVEPAPGPEPRPVADAAKLKAALAKANAASRNDGPDGPAPDRSGFSLRDAIDLAKKSDPGPETEDAVPDETPAPVPDATDDAIPDRGGFDLRKAIERQSDGGPAPKAGKPKLPFGKKPKAGKPDTAGPAPEAEPQERTEETKKHGLFGRKPKAQAAGPDARDAATPDAPAEAGMVPETELQGRPVETKKRGLFGRKPKANPDEATGPEAPAAEKKPRKPIFGKKAKREQTETEPEPNGRSVRADDQPAPRPMSGIFPPDETEDYVEPVAPDPGMDTPSFADYMESLSGTRDETAVRDDGIIPAGIEPVEPDEVPEPEEGSVPPDETPDPEEAPVPFDEIPDPDDVRPTDAGGRTRTPSDGHGPEPADEVPEPEDDLVPSDEVPDPEDGLVPADEMPEPEEGPLPSNDIQEPTGIRSTDADGQPRTQPDGDGQEPTNEIPEPETSLVPSDGTPEPDDGPGPAAGTEPDGGRAKERSHKKPFTLFKRK